MTMHPQTQWKIPAETETVTLAIFKKPNLYVTIAQKLGQIYEDVEFQSLFSPNKGQSAISPAVVRFGLRRCRYVGLEKTHLQNIAIACAINLTRVMAWFEGKEKKSTRISHFARLKETG